MPKLVSVTQMVQQQVAEVIAQRPFVCVLAPHKHDATGEGAAIWLGAAEKLNKLQEHLLLQVFNVTPQSKVDDGDVVDGRRVNIAPRPASKGPSDETKAAHPGYTWYWMMPGKGLGADLMNQIGAEAVRICTDYRNILVDQLMEEMTAPAAAPAPAPAPTPVASVAPEAVVTVPVAAATAAGHGTSILG